MLSLLVLTGSGLLLFGGSASAQQGNAPLVVDSTGDQDDSGGADGVCATASGSCTLRAAIAQANYNRGPDRIEFDIPGGGVHRIALDYALPTIADPSGGVVIDGYTQPGAAANNDPLISNAVFAIEVEGKSYANAFTIRSAANTIRGLSIFASKTNIELLGEAADGNEIIGNLIGTDTSLTFQRSSAIGVAMNLGPDQNVVGSPDPADRNVIAGNGGQGIRLNHGETSQNVIQNNIIGLDQTGAAALWQDIGVDLQWWTWGNLVGGNGPGEGNLIGGNGSGGVDLSHMATGNIVLGNRIGTLPDGRSATAATGNTRGVILKDDPRSNYFASNIISGNDEEGIWHKQNYTAGNFFVDNKIGVGVGGEAVGNDAWGVYLTGHDDLYHGNIVANNGFGGFNINNESLRDNSNWPDEQTKRNNVRLGTYHGNGGPLIQIVAPAHPDAATPTLTGIGPGEAYGNGTCAGCTVELYGSGPVAADGTVTAGPSGADGISLRAKHSGLCAEVRSAGTSNLADLVQATCNGASNQRFEIVPAGTGFLLRAVHSGKCLDVEGASASNGANVVQYDCHGGDNQLLTWSASALVIGHSGKCIQVDNASVSAGENLEQSTCDGGDDQQFGPDGDTALVAIGAVTADGTGSFSIASPSLQTGVVVVAVSVTPSGETSEFSGQLQVGSEGLNLGADPVNPLPAPVPPAQPPLPPRYQPEVFGCSASDGVLSWDDAGAAQYYMFATTDGQETYLGAKTTTSLAVAAADGYRVTHWKGGYPHTATCDGPGPAGEVFACSAVDGVLSWTDAGATRYYVFATIAGQDTYLGGHTGTSLVVAPADGYRVTHWLTGRATVATCDGPGPAGEVFACSAAGGVLSWTDAGAAKYYVFATIGEQNTYLGGHTGTSLAVAAADSYRVTHWLTGRATVATCDGPGAGAGFVCSVTGGVLSWTDAGASQYYVFATSGGQDTYLGSQTGTSLDVAPADEYRVTHWLGGRATRAGCSP